MQFVEVILLTLAVGLFIPTLLFVVECGLALWQQRSTPSPNHGGSPRIAVLVPAHNEAAGITPTLESLLPQLGRRDRLVVIADNCSDETAQVARSSGATVLERQDAQQRGKGYALDFGLQFLAADPPEVVVIVDADCLVMPQAISRIAQLAVDRGRPVQATYLLATPAQPKPKDAVSALAFTVKNWVRLAGLSRLGLHAILTGTGMAFPWHVLQRVSLASGNIVEDMQISVDLAIAGVPPIFCEDARVNGSLPQQGTAAASQRTRWEHGHLQTLTTQAPRLLQAALRQRRWDLLIFALDLSIPPLSLLVMLWCAIGAGAIGAAAFGASGLAAMISGLSISLILISVIAAWAKFAKQEISGWALLSIPFYILWKIPLYFKFLVKPQTQWIRTERDALDQRP
jgi:cellulose synthase/poly-beta-1,6-N-acetylglucosamine synthase-like glycosyltransferase